MPYKLVWWPNPSRDQEIKPNKFGGQLNSSLWKEESSWCRRHGSILTLLVKEPRLTKLCLPGVILPRIYLGFADPMWAGFTFRSAIMCLHCGFSSFFGLPGLGDIVWMRLNDGWHRHRPPEVCATLPLMGDTSANAVWVSIQCLLNAVMCKLQSSYGGLLVCLLDLALHNSFTRTRILRRWKRIFA